MVIANMQNRLCSLMNIYRRHYQRMYPSVVVVVLILTNPSSIGNYQRIDPSEIEVISEG